MFINFRFQYEIGSLSKMSRRKRSFVETRKPNLQQAGYKNYLTDLQT